MECKQNVKYKPFEWADLTLIIQFDFCPRCKSFDGCYNLKQLAADYEQSCTVKGDANYLSCECGNDMIEAEA